MDVNENPDYWDAENVQLTKIDVQVVKETATGVSLLKQENWTTPP